MSACTGMGMEFFAAQCLGIRLRDCVCCDVDPKARQFVTKFHKQSLKHVFHDMGAMSGDSLAGECEVNGGRYCVEVQPATDDLLVGGPPCPPYSQMRNDESLPEDHEKFGSIFGDASEPRGSFLNLVTSRRPLGGIVENVAGFGRQQRSGLFQDQSPLEYLVDQLKEIKGDDGEQFYTAFEDFHLDLAPWVQMSCPRTAEL